MGERAMQPDPHLILIQLDVSPQGHSFLLRLLLIATPGSLQLGHLLLSFLQLPLCEGHLLLALSEGLKVPLSLLDVMGGVHLRFDILGATLGLDMLLGAE